jgi:hypothetical protein
MRTFEREPWSIRQDIDPVLQEPPRHPLDFDPYQLRLRADATLEASTRLRIVDLFAYIAERRDLTPSAPVLLVLGDQQRLLLVCHDRAENLLEVDGDFKVSTGQGGFSACGVDTYTTPVGLHVIYDKHGSRLPLGRVLKSRLNTGINADISADPARPVAAAITTRAMWLSGREPSNGDSYESLIYIHGTSQEYALGQPVSEGCIRMANRDVAWLFDRVPMDTPLYIDPRAIP